MPPRSSRSTFLLPITALVILIILGGVLIYKAYYANHKPTPALTPEELLIQSMTAPGDGPPVDPAMIKSLSAPPGPTPPPDPKTLESMSAPSN